MRLYSGSSSWGREYMSWLYSDNLLVFARGNFSEYFRENCWSPLLCRVSRRLFQTLLKKVVEAFLLWVSPACAGSGLSAIVQPGLLVAVAWVLAGMARNCSLKCCKAQSHPTRKMVKGHIGNSYAQIHILEPSSNILEFVVGSSRILEFFIF